MVRSVMTLLLSCRPVIGRIRPGIRAIIHDRDKVVRIQFHLAEISAHLVSIHVNRPTTSRRKLGWEARLWIGNGEALPDIQEVLQGIDTLRWRLDVYHPVRRMHVQPVQAT